MGPWEGCERETSSHWGTGSPESKQTGGGGGGGGVFEECSGRLKAGEKAGGDSKKEGSRGALCQI